MACLVSWRMTCLLIISEPCSLPDSVCARSCFKHSAGANLAPITPFVARLITLPFEAGMRKNHRPWVLKNKQNAVVTQNPL